MNKFRKILIWAILSIMMQSAGLYYLDKVFLVEASNFEVVDSEPVSKNRDVDYSISSSAKNINVSDDARYISYFDNEKLMVLDTKSLEVKEVLTDKGREILYCNWIPDANILMIAEKVTVKSNKKIKISTYNVRNDVESKIVDALCPYEEGIKVDAIATSTGANTHYVGVSRTGYNSNIYRIDIESNVKNIGSTVPKLGAVKVVQRNDIVIYQDSINNIFYSYTKGKNKKLNLGNDKNLVLIGVDDDNKVYMGEISNQKITKITYGDYTSDPSTWQTITLEKPKDLKDIYINSDNQILVNDNLTGKVTNLTTKKVVAYVGQEIQITDKIVCSKDDNKIIVKSLTETE